MLHVANVNTDELRRIDVKTYRASTETSGCKVALLLNIAGPGIAGVQFDSVF